ncbi:MAG TPA: Gfo/Idh/MocA family oxidoreductase [Acidimicrobiales bacterium]
MSTKLRVGVVGVGVIGQVMHLHFLRELKDRYEIAAICDLSVVAGRACAEEYGVTQVFTDWREMITAPLDAIFILTSGSHAPIAIEAVRAGLHVFTEKPMCFSVAEGAEMVAEAEKADVALMVGYPKRYDPAFLRFKEEVAKLSGPRLLRVTTTESPFVPYVSHYPMVRADDVGAEVLAPLIADSDRRLVAAIGTNDPFLVSQYSNVLLDTLVHEINTTRGVLGEPDSLEFVEMRPGALNAHLTFGDVAVAIHWVDTPAMTRYSMEFALMAQNGRATLTFPSPYLRNAPTALCVESGAPGESSSWRRDEITSYESGFKEELVAFHALASTGTAVPTPGTDAVRDIAMCQAIIRSIQTKAPVVNPTQY